ncbi:hypothetical protein KUTeg_023203 [Tegillarca granosa]|uniref:Histone-lysine N-methyltransferase SETDB1 n=1 Tax=Tegillarca granosa TaxID=220873 RepID=A0ABQ9E756_TEGGR|nr:hypothetical protein KUTeg_023203 [Tegillarca granosa]
MTMEVDQTADNETLVKDNGNHGDGDDDDDVIVTKEEIGIGIFDVGLNKPIYSELGDGDKVPVEKSGGESRVIGTGDKEDREEKVTEEIADDKNNIDKNLEGETEKADDIVSLEEESGTREECKKELNKEKSDEGKEGSFRETGDKEGSEKGETSMDTKEKKAIVEDFDTSERDVIEIRDDDKNEDMETDDKISENCNNDNATLISSVDNDNIEMELQSNDNDNTEITNKINNDISDKDGVEGKFVMEGVEKKPEADDNEEKEIYDVDKKSEIDDVEKTSDGDDFDKDRTTSDENKNSDSENVSSAETSEKDSLTKGEVKSESPEDDSTDTNDNSYNVKEKSIKVLSDVIKSAVLKNTDSLSSSEDDDVVYEFDEDIDVEDLIASTIKELCCPPKKHEELDKFSSSLNQLSTNVKGVERKQRDINKIFNACTEKLERYSYELEEADRDQELLEAAAEAEAKEAAEANAKAINVDSDDDDVQFISTTFDPSIAAKQQQITLQNKSLAEALATASQVQSNPQMNPVTATKTMIYQLPTGHKHQAGSPTLQNLRAALTAQLQKQIHPTGQNSSGAPIMATKFQNPNAGMTSRSPIVQKTHTTQLNHEQTAAAYKKDFEDVKEGSKLYGKKHNDIWYKGTVTDISGKDRTIFERKYSVKFEYKGKKVLTAKDLAFKDPLSKPVCVGTRVIAMYKDDESQSSFYAGIVAETPNGRNQHRYLIFFDDGYAQYSTADDIHKVFYQSLNVWEDIMPDSQEFIKEYLKQYPERPMVRLHKGQTVKTEWNGRWWTAKVIEVDASLVKMFFLADKRIEWIYRGSTRLEPLFTALANAEANRALAAENKVVGKAKRHTTPQVNRKPFVEYTRGGSEEFGKSNNPIEIPSSPPEQAKNIMVAPPYGVRLANPGGSQSTEQKKRSVAKKSTGGGTTSINLDSDKSKSTSGWEPPWLKKQQQQQQNKAQKKNVTGGSIQTSKDLFRFGSISSNKTLGKDMASVLQERLAKVSDSPEIDEEAVGERIESLLPYEKKRMEPHKCRKKCVEGKDEVEKYKGFNPLLIPLLLGWERHVCKTKPSNKRIVMYKAPCARRLRSIEEVDKYLLKTDSNLTIDKFCFDPALHTHTEFVPVKTFCDIKDMSYGKEDVPISCVNGIDRQYPDYVEYSNVRIPAKGVNLDLNTEFLVGCDCTDGCRNKSKCACQQLTIESTACTPGAKRDHKAGYKNRRLKEPLVTGVYECNANCKCDSRCHNRVAQNGLRVRLQVFKTEKKGWGLRCLDDVPAGSFICIYAGQLLTDQGANEDGQQYGDEYLAELDYMEVVERQKEGYESDADMDEGLGDDSDSEDYDSEDGRMFSDSDSDFSGDGRANPSTRENTHHTRMRTKRDAGSRDSSSRDSTDKKPVGKLVLRRDSTKSGNKDDEWKTIQDDGETEKQAQKCVKLNNQGNKDMKDSSSDDKPSAIDTKTISQSVSVDSFGMDSDELPDLDQDVPISKEKKLRHTKPRTSTDSKDQTKSKSGTSDSDEDVAPVSRITGKPMSLRARKSTSNQSRFKNLPDPKFKESKRFKEGTKLEDMMEESSRPGTRSYFQDQQDCYIMDAKSMGNIGRYLNHSCSPNVYVQNVFVDSHDLRFPWVAFFAGQFIRAGTELTWDYNYEVGSVPGKILYCYCGSADCRGRLL